MQFSNREDIIAITPQWKGERFPDGRPKVADKYLDALYNMTLEELYDSDGDVKYKTETKYEYDQFGNHTLVAKYNTDGKLVDKTQCENYQIVYIGD